MAAGLLVVPLAIQESIAYAVPGFASAAAPAGAAAAAAGIPLVAKLATAGAAVALAGSAGVVAERSLHDPPTRPAAPPGTTAAQPVTRTTAGPTGAAVKQQPLAPLLPVPPASLPVAQRSDDRATSAMAAATSGRRPAAPDDGEDHGGPGNAADELEPEREDNSGPGGGNEVSRADDVTDITFTDEDHSGPGSGAGDDDGGHGEGGGGGDGPAGRRPPLPWFTVSASVTPTAGD